jgi:hypothetical protein
MECYVCARGSVSQPAVAVCKGCGAGLCIGHLRDAARDFDNGSLYPTCRHDTWIVSRPGEGLRRHAVR